MTPEQESFARTAIRHTQSVYNTSGDRGRVDDLLTAFVPDGVLEVPGASYPGHKAIHGFLTGVTSGSVGPNLAGSRHHLTTSRIEFESDTVALGWTYFFVMRQGTVIQEGTYIDRYVQAGERWLIAHRRVKMLYSTA